MNINPELFWGGVILAVLGVFLMLWAFRQRKLAKPKWPKLHLVFYQLTNKSISMATNSATLTDLLKHTFVGQATDAAGNTYGGTLAFTSVVPADGTQDLASADST